MYKNKQKCINSSMDSSKEKIKKFVHALSSENYAEAYKHLRVVLYEKAKKRCSDEYDRVSNNGGNK